MPRRLALLAVTLVCAATGIHAFTAQALAAPAGATLSSGRLLVRFRAGVSVAEEARVRRSTGAKLARSYRLVPGLELLTVGSGKQAKALATVAGLSRDPSVLYATPDVVYHVQTIPDDPLYSQQWGMESIGAPAAWSRTTGSSGVIVAVLDTGITLNHPDLEANVWTNPDPGQDGYVNDVHGWNFVAEDNNPTDDNGHGTHVSGIIGAVGNNGIGVAGVNWSVSLMPLKVCNAEGSCSLSDEIAALEYAVDHGAKVANASFGGAYGGYLPEEEAIQAAGKAGLLYVAAAGNSASDNDTTPFYPASYPLENVISVAASTSSNTLASFSDYGPSSVELAAPGEGILSTLPKTGTYSSSTGYGELSGTSMAAPQVSGAAALLWSEHPTWTMQQIRSRILTTTRPLASLFGKVSTCGELDLEAATNPAVPEEASLCVTRAGTGSGSVSSLPAGVNCGSSCSATFAPGTQVTLTATPEPGSTFAGWHGACAGTGPCTLTLSTADSVIATFRAAAPAAGWEVQPLSAPIGREPFAAESSASLSFYDVSLSADGSVRAKTIYNPDSLCSDATSNTGGVFLEHRTASGWVDDGSLTAPATGSDRDARWANCSSFGTVTALSADGSTLLVTAQMVSTSDPELGSRYRCAAFVYRHAAGGWSLDGTLFPPGVEANGSPSLEGCDYFGTGAAISDDGTRVAVLSDGRVDVFVREASGWTLEQHIVLPEGPGCHEAVGPREIALSGEATTLLVGAETCATGGDEDSGRVYAYTRSGSTWSLAQTINSPEAQFQNGFGGSVAISDDGSTATISVRHHATGLKPWAGASWIYERKEGSWLPGTRVTAPTPEENAEFSCPNIIEDGARMLCGANEAVGFNPRQGSIYIYERPAGGWSSSGSPTRLFAPEGSALDGLGTIGAQRWRVPAASANGSLIDATITPTNLADGTYADNIIGYEFGSAGSFSPTIASFSPQSGAAGDQVMITGTRLTGTSSVSFNGTPASEFSVDSESQITATVPDDATTGPISVTTPGGTATSTGDFSVKTTPSLNTTASGSIVAGKKIHDTATLAGGSSPTGTISFQLYMAADTTCTTPIGPAQTVAVGRGNGSYESPQVKERTAGVYQWLASYSGDEDNTAVTAACDEPAERVVVPAKPRIRTRASGTVLAGEEIHDTATLSHGLSPTGMISFQLYAAADTTCSKPLGPPVTTEVNSGDASYESPAILASTPGSYQWVASYTGDQDNAAVTERCDRTRESVVVETPGQGAFRAPISAAAVELAL